MNANNMSKKQWIIGAVILVLAIALSVGRSGVTALKSTTSSSGFATAELAFDDFAAEPMFFDEAEALRATDSFIPFPPTAGETAADVDQRIIKTGYVTLQVNDVHESIESVTAIADSLEGFVQSSNAGENYDGTTYGSITIRVPAEQYESALQQIRDAGLKVIDESTDTQDVTEQFTDLQARVGVAQEQEQAYVALLNRAGSVSELLEVQRELSNVRANIESLQGQIQYLENRTSLSTITVSFEELASVALPTKPFQPGSTVSDALQSVVVVFQTIIEALIWIVVLGVGVGLPIGLIAWLIYKGVMRKRK